MNDFIDKRKDNPRKRNMSPKLRFEILRRDGFTCQYCGKTATDKELEIDHLVPFSKGGSNDEGNLITSCKECNRGKTNTEIIPATHITKTAPVARTDGRFLPETVTKFKTMYAEKREFLEHLQKFGNDFERGAASLVICVAKDIDISNTNATA